MYRINYDRETDKIIADCKARGVKPKLLLHACCAPCASACVERLAPYFDVTLFFYNPNMDTAEEHGKRAEELKKLADVFGVNCVITDYEPAAFYGAVKGYEDCLEGGGRCAKCFGLRLFKTAEYAAENGYDYFTTTLTVSPLKNAELINETGFKTAEKLGVKFLPSDFKKKGGYLRTVELSREYGLYRQNYCGCEFSKRKNPV